MVLPLLAAAGKAVATKLAGKVAAKSAGKAMGNAAGGAAAKATGNPPPKESAAKKIGQAAMNGWKQIRADNKASQSDGSKSRIASTYQGSFKNGGHVKKTGIYLLHKGEEVIPHKRARAKTQRKKAIGKR